MNINQLSLLDNLQQNQHDDLPSYSLDLDSLKNDQDIESNPELLIIFLFKKAVKETNPNDEILNDFAEYILPNLLTKLAGITAKGGQFTEDRKAEGKNTERSRHDQSLISHILNGLFPTYRIISVLLSNKIETNPIQRHFNILVIKLFLASFPLHDFEKDPDFQKYLSETVAEFKDRNWRKDTPKKQEAPNLSRDYVKKRIQDLGIDLFLGENWENYIDDIVWLSHNAGDGSDADRGLESRGLKPTLNGRIRQHLHHLLRLSDLFVSIIKHPKDIEDNKFLEILSNLSNNQLQFTYHALSDNRGVITNIINNALITSHGENYQPLLYFPDGVIYVSKIDALNVNINNITDIVITKIKQLCATQIINRQTGFSRGGKGLKFAEYYWLFFEPIDLMKVGIKVAERIFPDTKKACSEKRSESLQNFQAKGELLANINVNFDNDIRIDRLAEFCDIICRGIWNKWLEKAENYQKQLPKKQRQEIPLLELIYPLAEYLGLESEISAIKEIQTLKKTGGVPLDWYYLAGKYYQTEKGKGQDLAQTIKLMEGIINHVQTLINPIVKQFKIEDGWNDLKIYINDIISLPTGRIVEANSESFLTEINRYQKAKITGRQRENICAMSSSSYTISEQMESGNLFAPQVYSNRQILFNAQAAKRQICSIWATEIMLRQILMNNTNSIGADFENRKYRYLYLYPAYFFTPETSLFLRKTYDGLEKTRFDAELRKHFGVAELRYDF
ncbi:type I-D CRISPR-associated protein Cas10d/Csc3 [Geminocystis sp.]|uniref:type I-D CRISPR-associated protein Cas10d/Csc3 n=1 Tax=Geminocystis sp. TaxID=2664100 RepID=UPI0035942BBB